MDARGQALFDMDYAAAEMRHRPIRELDDLHNLAEDIAVKARQWNPKDPQRTAELILESAFDELLDPPAWRFLSASVALEFVEPLPATRSMLRASTERGTDWFRIASDVVLP